MIGREAFISLYPDKDFNYNTTIKYSGKFKPYNARVQLRGDHLQFRLSKDWKEIDNEIVMGLLQHLLWKLFGGRNKKTFNMTLYHHFLKKLPGVQEAIVEDSLLLESFNRVNEKYFHNFMDPASLKWGQASTRTLAHYSLHTDTIVLSTIFKDAPQQLVDYVMHHEMLHKKHQFTQSGKQSRFHTKAFRDDEKKFGDVVMLEKELNEFLRRKKRKWSWF